jgi:hypothetical protein
MEQGRLIRLFNKNLNKTFRYCTENMAHLVASQNLLGSCHIQQHIRDLLMLVYKNESYIDILINKGIVNYSLNNGIFELSNYLNAYSVSEESDSISLITSMNFRILDKEGVEILVGTIECFYDEDLDNGDIEVKIINDVIEDCVVDQAKFIDKFYQMYNDNFCSIQEILEYIGDVEKKNSILTAIVYKIDQIIGTLSSYTDDDKRTIFMMTMKDDEE